MIKAVLMDIDGTLYPYSTCDKAGEKNMHKMLEELADNIISDDCFDELIGQAKRYVKSNTENTASCHSRLLYSHKLCELCGCYTAENVLKLYDSYWDAYLAEMTLFQGAEAFLKKVKENGLKLGFCTDLTAHIQMRKLVKLGLSDVADAVVTSEESGVEKPSQKPFSMLLEKLCIEPQQAVMIGDDYKKDIVGAEQCGITAIQLSDKAAHNIKAESYPELWTLLEDMLK